MNNCAVMQPGMKRVKNVLEPTASNSARNTAANDSCFHSVTEGKENMDGKHAHGWLAKVSKVCSKFCHKPRRCEKCEKCGEKSDTCVANPSFLSSRKHFLCESCRVSSHNVKHMYSQLYRNLSLHEPPRLTCNSADLSPPSYRGVVRSRSMRTRPPAPESGYDTATSLDSSCSNGRLSPEPRTTPSGLPVEGHGPSLQSTPRRGACGPAAEDKTCTTNNPVHARDRPEVFGGAFRSEKTHLREIQARPRQKVYTRQQPAPQRQDHREPLQQQQKQLLHKDTTQYDGFLEIRALNSDSVKYVFRQKEDLGRLENEEQQQSDHLARRRHSENLKLCYRCNKLRCIAFRAPFCNGWLCEDCMDDLM